MVRWYVVQIKLGKLTLDKVPTKWHDKVKEALESEE